MLGCIGKVKGKTIALIRHPAALEDDCRRADIVIAPLQRRPRLQGARVVIDRRALQNDGAHALYFDGLSISTESVADDERQPAWVRERPGAAGVAGRQRYAATSATGECERAPGRRRRR